MKIIIAGGGTAGWMAALFLKKTIRNIEITVIEPSNIPIIGVGEATTGLFIDLLKELDIDKFEFIKETGAFPKLGINFKNWKGDEISFISPIDGSLTETHSIDSYLYSVIYQDIDISLASVNGHFCYYNKTPWKLEGKNLVSFKSSAFHLDAYKVGEFFKKLSLNLGIKILNVPIKEVHVENNKIIDIELESSEKISADLFIDCTGFSRILMSKLKNNWVSYSARLPVDSVILFKSKNKTRHPYTDAIARHSGWQFEIPTRNKIGKGYIYSSEFLDHDKSLENLNLVEENVEVVKSFTFENGRFENCCVENCLCLGLSAGFLEPLQATSIHTTIVQLMILKENLNVKNKEFLGKILNENYAKLSDHLVDFIQLTYLGGRTDTEFWRYMQNAAPKSPRLTSIIDLAMSRLTRYSDFEIYRGFAGHAIWNYTLAGLGYFKKDMIKKILEENLINLDEVHKEWQKNHEILKILCDQDTLDPESLNSLLLRYENV